MKNYRFTSNLLAATLLALLFASVASAVLPTRTWVSGVGDDANPCSHTLPCKTFGAAISKTAAQGEINCLDAADFGALNITQSITIDCGGTLGFISAPSAGQAGISINADFDHDVVTLRNLSISSDSINIAFNGIVYTTAKAVHVENVRISQVGNCIEVNAGSPSLLTVDNATLSDCVVGVFAATSFETVVVNINNTRITNTSSGVRADNGSRVTIRDSTIYFNQVGVAQTSSQGANLGSTVTVINSTLGFSSGAALSSHSGEFILAFGNTFVNDVVVYNPNGGQIFTGADNNNSGSAPGTANGGSVPKI